MKFLDLNAEYELMKKDIDCCISNVLNSGHYLLGNNLNNLENNLCKFSGKLNAVGVKNATDAISLTLLETYIKGNPVIIPNFGAYPTSVATLNIVDRSDLYYVDVDRTMTMDYKTMPDIKNGIVIFVALFGNNGNLSKIREYCNNNNHTLIVDAAQSSGSGCEKYGDYVIYSFYPTKPLGCFGDGGMILSDKNIENIRIRRFYGQHENKIKLDKGINSRMDEIQSSIVNIKLNYFDKLTEIKRQIANRYLKIINGIKWEENSLYHQFVIMFFNREIIIKKLNDKKIPYMIHYPYHITDFYKMMANNNNVNYRINNYVLSIPCHPGLSELDIQKIEEFLYENKKEEVL